MDRRQLAGIGGMALIYLTVAIPVPLIALLSASGINADQTCLARGILTLAIVVPFFVGELLRPPTVKLCGMALALGFTALALTKAMLAWGPNLTMSVGACVPVGCFAIALLRGKPIRIEQIVCLVLAIAGVVITIQPWHDWQKINLAGLAWTVGGTLANACFIELMSELGSEPLARRMIWQAIGMTIVGLPGSIGANWLPMGELTVALKMFVMALLLGTVNFWANGVTMSRLSTTTFGVAIVGLTPLTVLSCGYVLGLFLSPAQWLGVGVTSLGVVLLALIPVARPTEEESTYFEARAS